MRWNGKETDSVDFTGVNEYSLFKITTSNIMRNSQKAWKRKLYLYPWTKQHNVNHRNETATSHNIDKTDETEQIQDDKGEEMTPTTCLLKMSHQRNLHNNKQYQHN